MPAPHELIAKTLTVWLAPVATAFPAIQTAPSGDWVKLGTAGDLNYDEDGVEVSHDQNIETYTPGGSTTKRKAFRTDEDFILGFVLNDMSPEQYAKALDDPTLTTVAAGAGTAGQKHFDVKKGLDVKTFALLARGQSSVDNALTLQYEAYTVFQSGNPKPVHKKGEPSGLAVEYTALEATAGEFVKIRVQTAAPSS